MLALNKVPILYNRRTVLSFDSAYMFLIHISKFMNILQSVTTLPYSSKL